MVLNVISAPPGWDKYVPEGAPLYVLESSFAERQAAKDARLRWNPDRKRWWTTEIDRALCLLDCASPDCRKALEAARAGKIASVEASQATDADVEIPRPDGLEYLPYQKAGIAFLQNHKNTFLTDEMGLGKTIQAIGFINSLPTIKPTIIVCPSSLATNWQRELCKWLTRPAIITILEGNPSTEIIDALTGLVCLGFQEWKQGRCQPIHSQAISNSKIVLNLRKHIRVFGTESLSDGERMIEQLRQPSHHAFVCIGDGKEPISAIKRPSFAKRSFSVNESSQIGQSSCVGRNASLYASFASSDLLISPAFHVPMESHGVNSIIPSNISNGLSSSNPANSNNDLRGVQLCPTHGITPIFIVTYPVVHSWLPFLTSATDQVNIIDESHFCKNKRSRRAKATIDLITTTDSRNIAITGTPICNRPAELWPLIHSLDPQTWKSWKYYVERYCGAFQTRYGWDVSNATNLDELQRKLRETIMVRRLKMDVLKELPAKRRQIVVMPAGSCQTYVNAENAAYDAIAERTAELRSRLELAKADDDDAAYKGIVAEMSREAMCDFTDISRVRHDTAVAKAPLVAEYVKEVLDNAGKVVLFAHHHDVLDVLERELKEFGLVRLDGNTPMAARQQAVDRFQNDSSVRVFLGGIIPAGVGITLTAASTVIFAELDWVPGNVTQAEDRCHRIGQTDSVTVYHIVLEGSIDEKMATTVVDKQEIIDKALNGGGQTQDEASKHVAIPVECATRTVSREQIATEAVSLTPNQVEAIHAALRFLSAHDQDYARTVNGVGYSKIDGNIGHSLSERIFLTPKQAVLGKKIALKYRRQLPEELVSTIKGE